MRTRSARLRIHEHPMIVETDRDPAVAPRVCRPDDAVRRELGRDRRYTELVRERRETAVASDEDPVRSARIQRADCGIEFEADGAPRLHVEELIVVGDVREVDAGAVPLTAANPHAPSLPNVRATNSGYQAPRRRSQIPSRCRSTTRCESGVKNTWAFRQPGLGTIGSRRPSSAASSTTTARSTSQAPWAASALVRARSSSAIPARTVGGPSEASSSRGEPDSRAMAGASAGQSAASLSNAFNAASRRPPARWARARSRSASDSAQSLGERATDGAAVARGGGRGSDRVELQPNADARSTAPGNPGQIRTSRRRTPRMLADSEGHRVGDTPKAEIA